MANPPHGQTRTSVILMLLVAVVSALVVVGFYEVRARLAKRRSPQSSDASALLPSASPERDRAPSEEPAVTAGDSCGNLRRRYLARCLNDLAPAPAPEGAAPSSPPGARESEARAAADLAVWLHPLPEELGAMARRCEVRFDLPAITENQAPAVTDEEAAALSLSDRERASIQRTLADMHAGLRDFAERAFAEAAGQSPKAAALTLEEILTDLQTRPDAGFEDAREKLAKERAGLTPPPASGARQPPGERLLREWADLGDRFERRLADELGADRAHQMRVSTNAGWMNRFSQSGCRGQAPRTASQ